MATSPQVEPCTDLAANRPGAGVEAEAKALRDKAPVRSFLARLAGAQTEERAWRVGAKGERLVAAQLGRLGPSWHVLHSIRLSETGTDLDHVVIGPAGVFSVNTKHHPDARVWVAGETFLVNGQRQSYVRASRSEGRKVARVLSVACGHEVAVTPVIAVVGASQGFQLKEQPVGVVVCTRFDLLGWLLRQSAVLSSAEVEAVFSVARLPTTWVATSGEATCNTSRENRALEQPPASALPGPIGALTRTPSDTARAAIVVTYAPAHGLRIFGDPRPHQGVVKATGFRWSGHQRCWYMPGSREQAPSGDTIDGLAVQLRSLGFSVDVRLAN